MTIQAVPSATDPMLRDPDLPHAVAVVCHDAGACNVILPWLQRPGLHVRAVMEGPALNLWRARFGAAPLCRTLEEALAGVQLVLTGTGWARTLEHDARLLAHRLGLPSAAVVDHWVNYPERFVVKGQQQWPDQFWLTDAEAVTLACKVFPQHRLRCYANRYLQEQVQAITPLRAGQGDVLLVMEPARSDWGRGVAGEWQALDFFMQQRRAIGIPEGTAIRLRPHPSDPAGKYSRWLALNPAVQLDLHSSLSQAMNGARWVVGCESYALVVALAAGRQVWSSLPPWAPACRLPHAGVHKLSDHATAAA
jgi:hypothetical protein